MRAAVTVLFGSVGGRYYGGFKVSKFDVARGEGAVWDMNGGSGSRVVESLWFVFLNRMLSIVCVLVVTLVCANGGNHHMLVRFRNWIYGLSGPRQTPKVAFGTNSQSG